MECFDISHNQGAETTGAMVVFESGRPNKKEYRRFKLQSTQGTPDDFKSMAEVMARRYGIETKWPRPDLIVLDGGKGQLDAALPVIEAVELIHRSLALPSVWKKSMWKGRRIRLSLIRTNRRCSSCNLFVMKPIVLLSLIIESGRQKEYGIHIGSYCGNRTTA